MNDFDLKQLRAGQEWMRAQKVRSSISKTDFEPEWICLLCEYTWIDTPFGYTEH